MENRNQEKNKVEDKFYAKFCPKCWGEVAPYAGGVMGMWKCKKCGFTSAIMPEKEIEDKINPQKIKKEKKK